MNSVDKIGGYFSLELNEGKFPYTDCILLNSGRSCFEYILKAQGATHVYMPRYTCDVMLEPLQKLGVKYSSFYIIVYKEQKNTKYCPKNNSKKLSDKYKEKLILDCSQAFYFMPLNIGHTFYSPRKFFGLPDGGILKTNKTFTESLPFDVSYGRFSHLIKRIDLGPEAGYEDFKSNDASLEGQPIKQISHLTRKLLDSIDFTEVKKRRINNFMFLHEQLKDSNKLDFVLDSIDAPMIYPYLTDNDKLREILISQGIFVATYWPNVLEWCHEQDLEYGLANRLLPLPIDQRYDDQDMAKIVEIINANKD